jgi:hypothetical protein
MDRLDGEKGGVAVVIRRGLRHKNLPAVDVDLSEVIGVKVNTNLDLPHIEMFRIHMLTIFAKFAETASVILYEAI